MVKQGDIIKVNLNPQAGYEQAGYRSAVVISNNIFNEKAKLAIICPVTNTKNNFPLHIPLDERTNTTGTILCEHVRTVNLDARPYIFIEKIPEDILENIIEVVFAEIEKEK